MRFNVKTNIISSMSTRRRQRDKVKRITVSSLHTVLQRIVVVAIITPSWLIVLAASCIVGVHSFLLPKIENKSKCQLLIRSSSLSSSWSKYQRQHGSQGHTSNVHSRFLDPSLSSLPPTSLLVSPNDVDVEEVPSLYKEQERLLVERGIIEEQLMTTNALYKPIPIEPSVTKGTGTVKGFGGSGGGNANKSKRSSTADLKAAAKIHAKELRKSGVVRIDNVLSDEMADTLLDYVTDLRSESEQLVRSGQVKSISRFADVLLKHNRCDLTLPIDNDIVVDALTQVMEQSPVGYVIATILGKDAGLYELSCLISDPGSQRQVIHPDTPCGPTDNDPVLYTCFIALQDITADMGPTVFLPGTHTKSAHEVFQDDAVPPTDISTTITNNNDESPKDRLLRTSQAVLGIIPKGTCTIFDSRLLHGGTANTSTNNQSRAIFYCSFKSSTVGYAGNPGSIRRDLIGKYTLTTLQKELKQLQKQRKKSSSKVKT